MRESPAQGSRWGREEGVGSGKKRSGQESGAAVRRRSGILRLPYLSNDQIFTSDKQYHIMTLHRQCACASVPVFAK